MRCTEQDRVIEGMVQEMDRASIRNSIIAGAAMGAVLLLL